MKKYNVEWKSRKKVNFENTLYNKVQDLCFELFGDRCVIPELDRYMISILSPSLIITFSGNEDKMYFNSFIDPNKEFIRSTSETQNNGKGMYDFLMCQHSFRVFGYEQAEKYLRFKKQELDIIKSIEG